MPLLNKFPYNETGHQHWEAMKEIFSDGIHETYTGAQYYEEHEAMLVEGEDRPWCLHYTKKAFVTAWNKMKKNYQLFAMLGGGQ